MVSTRIRIDPDNSARFIDYFLRSAVYPKSWMSGIPVLPVMDVNEPFTID